MNTKPKTAADLKYLLASRGAEPHFFSRNNMRFAGDTMRNYGVRGPVEIETYTGKLQCWELYRRRAVKYGLKDSAFFDCETLVQCFPERKYEAQP